MTLSEIHKFAHRLIGTTGDFTDENENTPDDVISGMTVDECHQLDAMAFSCQSCGWWFAKHECVEKSGWYCEECAADV